MSSPEGILLTSRSQEDLEAHNLKWQCDQIDALIAAATSEEERRLLKERRNMLAPISQLPPELLSRAFLFIVQDYWHEMNVESFRPLWIEVTHVCHRWRAIALSYPQLWSRISSFSSNWTDVQLERSKQAPLYIHIPEDISEPKVKERLSKAFAWPHRLRSVSNSTPPAESLMVAHAVTPVFLNLSGNTPQLRRLNISGWVMQWNSPLLSGLTSLKLSPGITSAPLGSMAECLAALQRMPMLVEFELSWSFAIIHNSLESADDFPIVKLPHLARLSLQISVSECIVFLNHLACPPSTRFNIETVPFNRERLWRDDDELRKTIVPSMASCLQSAWLSNPLSISTLTSTYSQPIVWSPVSPHFSIKSMYIGLSTNGLFSGVIIRIWLDMVDFTVTEDPQHANSPQVLYKSLPLTSLRVFLSAVRIPGSLLANKTIGFDLFTTWPVKDLRSLAMRGKFDVDSFQVVGDFSSLELIQLVDEAFIGFLKCVCDGLPKGTPSSREVSAEPDDDDVTTDSVPGERGVQPQPEPDLNQTDPVHPLLFPNLIHINIVGAHFTREDNSVRDDKAVDLDDLLNFLIFRRDTLRKPIQRVQFFNCYNLLEGHVEMVSGLVPEVRWDYREQSIVEYECNTQRQIR